MNTRTILLAAVGLVVSVVLLPSAAEAWEPGFCSGVCTQTSPCDKPCMTQQFEEITCGDWGPCECSWIESSRTQIGRHQSGPVPVYCDYWVSYRIQQYWSCNPSQTLTRCEDVHDGWGVNMNCCQAWGCWGQQC